MVETHSNMLDRIKRAEDYLTRKYAKKLLLNADLDRTLVSFQRNKRENGHRWCKYKEGFSASLMRYVFRKVGLRSGCILDPFAGSGTALFAASEVGLDAVGIELLPYSSEIIEVRKLVEDSDKDKLASSIRRFKKTQAWEREGRTKKFCHLRITDGAFPEETERQLGRFLYDAGRLKDVAVGRLLRFAALCVLESISYTRKDGQYLRWDSRSGRRAGGKPFNKGHIPTFSEAIESKFEQIAQDLNGEITLFDRFPARSSSKRGDVKIHVGSCLDILPLISSDQFDGLVTSPPYCNRYDYTRTYALELAMLGTGEDEVKNLRQTMLSCTVENREKDDLGQKLRKETFAHGSLAFESQEVLREILNYLEQCRVDGSINNTGIPRMVRNYFREMALVIFECARVLKPGSPFVMVNDNVRYQGVHVPVDLILSDFAEAAGFDVEAIWVLPKGKGNSSQQMGLHGRQELRKCVYVWRAKGERAKKLSRRLAAAR